MSINRRNVLGALALAASTETLTAAETSRRPTSASEVWARTELYFGTSRAIGQPVSDAEFTHFVESEVTERFPEGLTVLTGYGQFRSGSGLLVKERSHLLILFYPAQTQDANKRIQEIRDIYKSLFRQESVLRADSFSFISF